MNMRKVLIIWLFIPFVLTLSANSSIVRSEKKCMTSKLYSSKEIWAELKGDSIIVQGYENLNCCWDSTFKVVNNGSTIQLFIPENSGNCKCMCPTMYKLVLKGYQDNSYTIQFLDLKTNVHRTGENLSLPEMFIHMQPLHLSSYPKVYPHENRPAVIEIKNLSGGCSYQSKFDSISNKNIYISATYNSSQECIANIWDSVYFKKPASGNYTVIFTLKNQDSIVKRVKSFPVEYLSAFSTTSIEQDSITKHIIFKYQSASFAQCHNQLKIENFNENTITLSLVYCPFCKCLSKDEEIDLGLLKNGNYKIVCTSKSSESESINVETKTLYLNITDHQLANQSDYVLTLDKKNNLNNTSILQVGNDLIINNPDNCKVTDITVFNLLGKKYNCKYTINPSATTMNIGHLPSGLYLVRIVNCKGNAITKKIKR